MSNIRTTGEGCAEGYRPTDRQLELNPFISVFETKYQWGISEVWRPYLEGHYSDKPDMQAAIDRFVESIPNQGDKRKIERMHKFADMLRVVYDFREFDNGGHPGFGDQQRLVGWKISEALAGNQVEFGPTSLVVDLTIATLLEKYGNESGEWRTFTENEIRDAANVTTRLIRDIQCYYSEENLFTAILKGELKFPELAFKPNVQSQ